MIAANKLTGWRKKAVLENLPEENKDSDKPPDRHRLGEAYQLMHEHFSNIQIKERNVLDQVIILSATALLALCVIVILSTYFDITSVNEFSMNAGKPLPVTLSVLMFGILGACLSAIFSPTGSSKSGIVPDLQINSYITFTRPILGAISALIIYTFIISGLFLPSRDLNIAGILAICFVAGFSERLIIRVVKTIIVKAESKIRQP